VPIIPPIRVRGRLGVNGLNASGQANCTGNFWLKKQIEKAILRTQGSCAFLHSLGQTRKWPRLHGMSVLPSRADIVRPSRHVRLGRVEDGRGSLSHSATLRFPSPLIEPDVPISGIRLSDWLHREVYGEQTNRTRLR